jgi:ubiquinol-cytochrome c reductase subunit 7
MMVKASGYRAMGLKYDDLLMEEREDVQKVRRSERKGIRLRIIDLCGCFPLQAIGRLTPEQAYDRSFRLRTAIQQSILHKPLPKDQWVKPEEVNTRRFRQYALPPTLESDI